MRLNLLKNSSLAVSENLARISSEHSHALRQANCGTFLRYSVTPGTLEMALNRANWCSLRSCPTCNWVRAVKRRVKVFAGLSALQKQHPNFKYAFLTLTVKNCHRSELRSTFRSMDTGWVRFANNDGFPALGYLKSIEVTRPRDCFYANQYLGRFGSKLIRFWHKELKTRGVWDGRLWRDHFSEECHPHIHALLVLPSSYEPGASEWLNHLDWVVRWKLAMKLSYRPVVDVRFVYSREDKGISNAVFEATKYALKPLDMLDPLAPFIFRQLHGLKLNSVGGILRSYINDEILEKINNQMTSGDEYQQNGVPLEYKWSNEDEQYWISKIAGQTL